MKQYSLVFSRLWQLIFQFRFQRLFCFQIMMSLGNTQKVTTTWLNNNYLCQLTGKSDCYFWPAAAAKSHQLCPTLCNPIDGSPLVSAVPGILQARTLEWVVISFSNAWKWKVKVKSLSRVRLLVTPWIAAHQAPPSIEFSRQEYWSGLPLPSPIFDLVIRI